MSRYEFEQLPSIERVFGLIISLSLNFASFRSITLLLLVVVSSLIDHGFSYYSFAGYRCPYS